MLQAIKIALSISIMTEEINTRNGEVTASLKYW